MIGIVVLCVTLYRLAFNNMSANAFNLQWLLMAIIFEILIEMIIYQVRKEK